MQRAGACESDKSELEGVVALLDGAGADRVGHAVVDQGDHADGGVQFVQLELRGEPLDGLLGQVGLDGHGAAQEVVGPEPAKREVGVGDRGLGAAEPVARRPGPGARAAGPNPEGAPWVDVGDAAATSAQRVDVDHGYQDRVAGDPGVAGGGLGDPARGDNADVGAGAAHVEGDQVVAPAVFADL